MSRSHFYALWQHWLKESLVGGVSKHGQTAGLGDMIQSNSQATNLKCSTPQQGRHQRLCRCTYPHIPRHRLPRRRLSRSSSISFVKSSTQLSNSAFSKIWHWGLGWLFITECGVREHLIHKLVVPPVPHQREHPRRAPVCVWGGGGSGCLGPGFMLALRSRWPQRSSASISRFCCKSIACASGRPPTPIPTPTSTLGGMPAEMGSPAGMRWPCRSPRTKTAGSLYWCNGYCRTGWACRGGGTAILFYFK